MRYRHFKVYLTTPVSLEAAQRASIAAPFGAKITLFLVFAFRSHTLFKSTACRLAIIQYATEQVSRINPSQQKHFSEGQWHHKGNLSR